ncbi:MAG: hypothetical protein R3B07_02150 [Polyangiaceae bacterium]
MCASPTAKSEYLDEGSGPPVVLVHPFLTDTRHYRKLVPLLSGNHRVIVPLLQLGTHRVPLPGSSSKQPPRSRTGAWRS